MISSRYLNVMLSFLIILFALSQGYNNYHRDSDICSHWNGRRHFLELGERGDLHAWNTSVSFSRNSFYSALKNRTNLDIWYQCNLELVTCAECIVRITFTYQNFSKFCDKSLTNGVIDGRSKPKCPCDYILFSEPPYDTEISGKFFCGDGKILHSKTRTLMMKFYYRPTYSHVFSLQYYSERNVQILSGSPKQSIISNYSRMDPQVISTPYFPVSYPRDYEIEHILTCEVENCHVKLDFTDFQLGLSSNMEIFDSNGQMIDSYTGEHFRPPIIISSGKSLLLQFRGNGATGIGYKAEITFISSNHLQQKEMKPYTDCGGVVTGLGGAITMMNMIKNSTETRLYECIWIIKPGNNYMMMKTHVSLRIDSFYGMASSSDITIRQGFTSDSPEIETVSWPNTGISKKNHIVPVLTGYYIKLKATFGLPSRLAIVYSVFNYMNCYIGSEFLCQNNHCISLRLRCDGFDHCGDESDEPESCKEDWAHLSTDRQWYSHKPNYYFPKIETYPDLRAATGVFIMSTLGILLVLSGWMVILYRMGVRARHQRELQTHLQTISELLDRTEEQHPMDNPPDYEAPPDYEEVIKVGMDNEMNVSQQRRQKIKRKQRGRHSRSGSRSRQSEDIAPPSAFDATNIRDVPSVSLENYNMQQQQQSAQNLQNVIDCVLSSTIACEVTEASTSGSWCTFNEPSDVVQPNIGSVSCNPSVPIRGDLSCCMHQPGSSHSIGTTTQSEESSEFKDASFNVSFSLTTLPASPLIDATSLNLFDVFRCNDENRCNTAINLLNLRNPNRIEKVHKLRHTYSTPESFNIDCLLLHVQRSSSGLQKNQYIDDKLNSINVQMVQKEDTRGDTNSQIAFNECTEDTCKLLKNKENSLLHFGNVISLGATSKQKYRKICIKSKSFNQGHNRRNTGKRLKRSSSANLLLSNPSQS